MRKILIFILPIFFIGSVILVSDIIPDNSHFVSRSIMITNINQMPGIKLISYITGSMPVESDVYIVEENEPLYKGFKWNRLQLFAIKDSLIEAAGGIENIDFKEIAKRITPADILDPYKGYVNNKNPLVKEYHYYHIQQDTESHVKLKLYKSVFEYNDGSENKVIYY
jgi:hypothetical protein